MPIIETTDVIDLPAGIGPPSPPGQPPVRPLAAELDTETFEPRSLALPLRLAGNRLAAVEQDSPEEIAQCVEVVCRYPRGLRPELPDFGSPDLAFREVPVGTDELAAAIERWEPRANALLEEDPDLFAQAISVLGVSVRGGGSGD